MRGGIRVLVPARWSEPRGALQLGLEAAIRVLSEPLHVLVENGLRDAAFIRRIMPPDWRTRFCEWEKFGRVRFEHAGGIDEMHQIVSFMASSESASAGWGIPAEAWCLIHYLIFDHDGETSQHPSKESHQLGLLCEKRGLRERYHRLERRQQEYYLPREAMRWIAENQVTNGPQRQDALQTIEAFFQGDRCHGPLPNVTNSQRKKAEFWKSRFWIHRGDTWNDGWFEADGATREGQRIAEALERLL